MKPASIIFLIVALLFGIGGYACMKAGQSKAVEEGIDLLEGTAAKEEDYVFTYDYSDGEIGKISINLKNSKVNIIGGSKKAYVELINFAEGMYEFSASNRNLTVSNNSDFSEIADMASLVFNFKGLRSLVNYYNIRGREKTVNIYLTDDCPVKIIECKLENGDVEIACNSSQTDYNVTLGDGNVELRDITTGSAANINISAGNLKLNNCSVTDLSIDVKNGDVQLITSAAYKMNVNIGTGDFDFGYRDQLAYVNLNLFTAVGKVTLDSTEYGGFYEVTDLPTSAMFEVNVDKGDIVMKSGMMGETSGEEQ